MTGPSRLSTLAVHAGERHPNPDNAIVPPIACTATYTFRDTAELRDHFEGRLQREEYGRYGNPSVAAVERKLAALEDAEECALFASGMAAISTTLFALLRSGQHVVLTADGYRRTRQFVTELLRKFGVEATLVEPGDHEALAAAIVPGKTRVVLGESPTNPYLRVADLDRLAAIKAQHRGSGLKVVIDATFATPVNLQALRRGADLVVHSGTKYLGGHNDLLAGAVCGSAGLVAAIRDLRGMLGGVLDGHSAYLLHRGLKTLALRVERQNASALRIAGFLEGHPEVERVFYPGLPSHPDHAVAREQMRGFGGVVSFLVRGDLDRTSRFIDACQVPRIGPSLGGVESLIEQPALMSFFELSTAEREAIGIRDNLIRLAVGVEDVEDLIADLDRALRT
ncbi:trans-sulfuration enzyme family protein [Nannocystis punicea]|uniref:Aminotransferase class I/II-fold pyridoxal phosphate-dependent enzyme n=1 Tax=Nannocystis punicea TaxID=2995304 RepID=A0ABY7HE86_9BACT|nr:aminotransferase class I/II-fold pyridoxal phosphate-dependent enzyme [Nannocystis poenicansa]WAS97412.1 aminotransferase class I/II-fold pyridoxal phosphate-dependent enzyme [Nannocystis poenicansa]